LVSDEHDRRHIILLYLHYTKLPLATQGVSQKINGLLKKGVPVELTFNRELRIIALGGASNETKDRPLG
jgi:hypothetical protein